MCGGGGGGACVRACVCVFVCVYVCQAHHCGAFIHAACIRPITIHSLTDSTCLHGSIPGLYVCVLVFVDKRMCLCCGQTEMVVFADKRKCKEPAYKYRLSSASLCSALATPFSCDVSLASMLTLNFSLRYNKMKLLSGTMSPLYSIHGVFPFGPILRS